MKVRYTSSKEFTYNSFPTAETVIKWFQVNLDTVPLKLYGEDQGGWYVEWARDQCFLPIPVIELDNEDSSP